jgi:hypothetical protein
LVEWLLIQQAAFAVSAPFVSLFQWMIHKRFSVLQVKQNNLEERPVQK